MNIIKAVCMGSIFFILGSSQIMASDPQSPSQVMPADQKQGPDCSYEATKDKSGDTVFTLTGKDCEQVAKDANAAAAAETTKGRICCECEEGPPIICRGSCCGKVLTRISTRF
jgi:hypothetical protein